MHINLPFTRSRKSKDVEIVAAEMQLINSVLVGINVYRMLTGCVKDASIAIYENAKAFA